MSDSPNTVFLRLEGPLQAWGDNSKFVIRRTVDAPTKSGVLGLVCSAMGWSRRESREHLRDLNTLALGVRIDRSGTLWWDYHTVGASCGVLTAQGIVKKTASTGEFETLISRREYLCDASFLVVLQGDTELIQTVVRALEYPKWPLFLGRKACPPSVPILVTRLRGDGTREADTDRFESVKLALASRKWHPRFGKDSPRNANRMLLNCLMEWRAPSEKSIAPADAEVWYDAPVSFDPPVHEARLIVREPITAEVGRPLQQQTPAFSRKRADYKNEEYKKRRKLRLKSDHELCVFCKSPANTVQHVTYRRAGGRESQEDLRSLCRLCHDAVTMIEYGLGMGLDRINPEEPQWHDQIARKRHEIIKFRSLETRRRRLKPKEVE